MIGEIISALIEFIAGIFILILELIRAVLGIS